MNDLTAIIEEFGGFGRQGFDFLASFYGDYRIFLEGLGLLSSFLFFGLAVFYIVRLKVFDFRIQRYQEILSQKTLNRSHSIRAWQRIKKRLSTGRQEEMKLAIVEADKILNELLKVGGYAGKDLEEKLKLADSAQLSNIESLRETHQFCRRILSEPELVINYAQALENLKVYAQAFQELELIS